jgi:hypothetical protein
MGQSNIKESRQPKQARKISLSDEPKDDFWDEIVRTVFTHEFKRRSQEVVFRWYATAKNRDNEMLYLWKSFAVNNNNPDFWKFELLTAYIESRGKTWQEINAFRLTFYNAITDSLIFKTNIANSDQVRANGSNSRTSDIDITITKEPVRVALILAYAFGLISIVLFGGDDERYDDVDYVVIQYLTKLSPISEIATYSSNGVILSDDLDLSCPASNRNLSQVSKNLYQVVQKSNCDKQNNLFKVIACLLMDRLSEELSYFKNINSDKLNANINLYKNRLTPDLLKVVEQATRITEQTEFDKFKTQIWASNEADNYAKQLTQGNCNSVDFCTLAAEWEQYQILANIASPESAWAVQTFVVVVLDLQKHMGNSLLMSSGSYWVVFLENLASLVHMMKHDQIRKAYKYALRLEFVTIAILGESVSFCISDEEYKTLREEIPSSMVKNKLLEIVRYILPFVFQLAPASVRLNNLKINC